MLRHRVFFAISRGAWVWAAMLVTMSCSGQAPLEQTTSTAPSPSFASPVAVTPDRSAPASPRDAFVFPLLNGTFVVTTEAGDRLVGTLSGQLVTPLPDKSTVRLELRATGGSGIFQGASGVVTGDGDGDIGGDGRIMLSSLKGVLTTAAQPAGMKFQMTVRATSSLSCSPSARILLTMRGEGTVAMVGRATAVLTSEIGETQCQS